LNPDGRRVAAETQNAGLDSKQQRGHIVKPTDGMEALVPGGSIVYALPTPAILRRYLDESAGRIVPAYELRWDESSSPPRERLWELPEHVSLIGLPPQRFGVKIECVGADAYAVVVLWDRTRFVWDGLTRVQLLTSALAPLLKALGNDLRSTLEQSTRTAPCKLQKVA
jgi:hypothetical protein